MYNLRALLLMEEKHLQEIIQIANSQLENLPEGHLRVGYCNHSVQYYRVNRSETGRNGIYIPKSEDQLIRQLAQRPYSEKVLRLAEKRIKQIKRITKDYQDDEIEQLYVKENKDRRCLITPVRKTWQQELEEWIAIKYSGKSFAEGSPEIYTEKGERVRSKSEKIIADYFFRNGIPYKYEKPLYLKGYGVVYPDFTLLSRRTRQEIYWEHEGRMDDPVYSRKAVKKLNLYGYNNINLGERLILTFETAETPLNTKEVERLCRKYLL